MSEQKLKLLAHAFGYLPHVVTALVAIGAIIITTMAAQEKQQYQMFVTNLKMVNIKANLPRPTPSQDNIDLATTIFSIQIEDYVSKPVFDESLMDRGLTSGSTLAANKFVSIGSAAFTSWAVLGSTLGHEIEVHCRQSFSAILVLDRISNVTQSAKNLLIKENVNAGSGRNNIEVSDLGTWQAERTAYNYEISSEKRFGLSVGEVNSIKQVMDYYYASNAH